MAAELLPKNEFTTQSLDEILTLQLLIAWAGEEGDEPKRLGWWRTSMVDEFGGEDLFKRLLPTTWRWAVLEAARAAAKKVDARSRGKAADADQLISLFHFGFTLDEQLDDRLAELKQRTDTPSEVLPGLSKLDKEWKADSLLAWLGDLGPAKHASSPAGRRITGKQPSDVLARAKCLAAAHAGTSETYPSPHYRRQD